MKRRMSKDALALASHPLPACELQLCTRRRLLYIQCPLRQPAQLPSDRSASHLHYSGTGGGRRSRAVDDEDGDLPWWEQDRRGSGGQRGFDDDYDRGEAEVTTVEEGKTGVAMTIGADIRGEDEGITTVTGTMGEMADEPAVRPDVEEGEIEPAPEVELDLTPAVEPDPEAILAERRRKRAEILAKYASTNPSAAASPAGGATPDIKREATDEGTPGREGVERAAKRMRIGTDSPAISSADRLQPRRSGRRQAAEARVGEGA
ncbi:hypothetical protein BJY59DRAFT_39627 [Rhodotorula toruloides]